MFFAILDHGWSNSILDTSSRIEHFHVRQNQRLNIVRYLIESHKWCIAYCINHCVKITHLTWKCFCLHIQEKISPGTFLTMLAALLLSSLTATSIAQDIGACL